MGIKVFSDLELLNGKIRGLADPTNPDEAATKNYVDNAIANNGGGVINIDFYLGLTQIVNTQWTDNGDGTYSYTIDLSSLPSQQGWSFVKSAQVIGAHEVPSAAGDGKEVVVQVDYSYTTTADGSLAVNSIKITSSANTTIDIWWVAKGA